MINIPGRDVSYDEWHKKGMSRGRIRDDLLDKSQRFTNSHREIQLFRLREEEEEILFLDAARLETLSDEMDASNQIMHVNAIFHRARGQLKTISPKNYARREEVYLRTCIACDGLFKAGLFDMHWHHMFPVHAGGNSKEVNMVYVTTWIHELLHALRAEALRGDGTANSYNDAGAADIIGKNCNKIFHEGISSGNSMDDILALIEQAKEDKRGIMPPMLAAHAFKPGNKHAFKPGHTSSQGKRKRKLSQCKTCAANGKQTCVCHRGKKTSDGKKQQKLSFKRR
jgi:hypothetical protein